jgi:hypothetical protein
MSPPGTSPQTLSSQPRDRGTVALRVLVRRILDLRRWIGIASDLGIRLPQLSVADPRLPIVRGPSAAHTRARGGHGRRARRSSEPAGDACQLGRWVRPVLVSTCLVGKSPEARGSRTPDASAADAMLVDVS